MLIIGMLAVLLMGVVVVTDASAAYLQRQSLNSLADGAAIAAADGAARGLEIYGGGLDDRLVLSLGSAREEVEGYLTQAGAATQFPGLDFAISADPANSSIVVQLTAPLDLPLTIPGSPSRIQVSSTGSAVVTVDQ